MVRIPTSATAADLVSILRPLDGVHTSSPNMRAFDQTRPVPAEPEPVRVRHDLLAELLPEELWGRLLDIVRSSRSEDVHVCVAGAVRRLVARAVAISRGNVRRVPTYSLHLRLAFELCAQEAPEITETSVLRAASLPDVRRVLGVRGGLTRAAREFAYFALRTQSFPCAVRVLDAVGGYGAAVVQRLLGECAGANAASYAHCSPGVWREIARLGLTDDEGLRIARDAFVHALDPPLCARLSVTGAVHLLPLIDSLRALAGTSPSFERDLLVSLAAFPEKTAYLSPSAVRDLALSRGFVLALRRLAPAHAARLVAPVEAPPLLSNTFLRALKAGLCGTLAALMVAFVLFYAEEHQKL